MLTDISWMFELTNLSLADPTNEGYNQKNYVKVSKFSNLINDYNINQKEHWYSISVVCRYTEIWPLLEE